MVTLAQDDMARNFYNDTDQFQPRPYQSELLNRALDKNIIACLNTGSGKTFIAVMLIKSLQHEITKSLADGGRRTFFLVDTVPLVKQQSKVLRVHTNLLVGDYVGADGVDMWNKSKWKRELETYQVFVMTHAILCQMLGHGYINVNQINLLIFDECHHAVGNHPYVQIMRDFVHKSDRDEQPRIFGMTASLVHGKCNEIYRVEKMLKNLESILLSQICTTKFQDALLRHSTKPKESTLTYDRVENDSDSIPRSLNSLNKTREWLEQLNQKPEYSLYNSFIQVLNGMINDCHSCYLEIGDYGLHHIACSQLQLLNNALNGTNFDDVKQRLSCLLQTNLKAIQKELEQFGKNELQAAYDNPKIFQLLSILRKHSFLAERDKEDFCCIVFVEKRCIAMTLNSILNSMSEADIALSFIKCGFIVGHGVTLCSSLQTCSMPYRQQKNVITRFRAHDINILIATNVVEEGIDVPKCNLIVRFNEIRTFGSYLQSKGRARAKNAHYIVMVEQDNRVITQDLLNNWSCLEQHLQARFREDEEASEKRNIEGISLVPPYSVESTGATATMSNSIQLVNWYCSVLPRDANTPASPKTTVKTIIIKAVEFYQVSLQLPSCSPLTEVIWGPPASTEKVAKMATALMMCQKLHKIGQLDDNLIPIKYSTSLASKVSQNWINAEGKSPDNSSGNSTVGDGNANNLMDNDMTTEKFQIYTRKLPKVLAGSHPKENSDLHLYFVEFTSVPPYKAQSVFEQSHFGILVNNQLPELPSLRLRTPYGTVECCISLCKKKPRLTLKQLHQIHEFNQRVFKYVFRDAKSYIDFNASQSYSGYLLVPVFVGTKVERNLDIDYDSIRKTIRGEGACIPIDLDMIKRDSKALRDTLIIKDYGSYSDLYEVTRICPNRCPLDIMKSGDKTFMTYYKETYEREIQDQRQPLLNVRTISKKPSLLVMGKESKDYNKDIHEVSDKMSSLTLNSINRENVETSYISQKDDKLLQVGVNETNEESSSNSPSAIEVNSLRNQQSRSYDHFHVELIPELCKMFTISASAWKVLHCMKCYLWRFESLLLAKELTTTLASYVSENAQSSAIQSAFIPVLEASTLAKASGNFNLERFEFLGDSFLKFAMATHFFLSYSNHHEGQLTDQLQSFVSNANLSALGKKKGLPGYIISETFKSSLTTAWIPPCCCVSNEDKNDSLKIPVLNATLTEYLDLMPFQILNSKSVADVVEALLAVILIEFGIASAFRYLNWLDKRIVISLSVDIPICSEDAVQLADICKYYKLMELESALNYRFQNKQLLISAITHSSYNHKNVTINCYQRLEFLGDAVLHYLSAQYFFDTYKNASPGDLHNFQEALVSNWSLGVFALAYRLHKYMFHESMVLYRDICEAEAALEEVVDDRNELLPADKVERFFKALTESMYVPKFLGDMIEAITGAIFIDSNKSLDTVFKVMLAIFKPRIETFSCGAPLSAVRQLHEKFPSGLNFTQDSTNGEMSLELPGGFHIKACGSSVKHSKRILSDKALKMLKDEEGAANKTKMSP